MLNQRYSRVSWPLQCGAGALAALLLAPLARADAAETITATAQLKTSGGVEATAPVRIAIDRFSTDAERDELFAAVKARGTQGARDLLLTRNPVGSLQVGGNNTAIKFVYAKPTTEGGRTITVVTGSPVAFIGAGVPGAAPKGGFDLGLLKITMTTSGPGSGELMPATKVRLDDQGAITVDDYSNEIVRLSNVVGK